jgi:hypothetical protein
MHVTCEPLPSPLMGEGAGGGEGSPSSPHPDLLPPRGEGVWTYPRQPSRGEGNYLSWVKLSLEGERIGSQTPRQGGGAHPSRLTRVFEKQCWPGIEWAILHILPWSDSDRPSVGGMMWGTIEGDQGQLYMIDFARDGFDSFAVAT